ncbi:MAG TPA: YigZ family protein [Candidatus Onthousia faecipullorum]|uniref:YigZ family protein n=1 Tax=Candidatus Onthousia faecipullorum TaxID=2840887 RepID=A0A9D1KBW8_9FIRM|nr:YigZ family protein [Candidatus Onthousia faecipullorum]
MKSIIKKEIYEVTIKNSKFIGVIIPIESLDDVKDNINDIKEEYKNATHYCYAFTLINNKGFSDDGEPNKTAGIPILNVIEDNNLVNVLVIVIRYFGGIKLGPGGLIRAYSNTCKEVINKSTLVELINGIEASITFSYSKEKEVNYLLKNSIIKNKLYEENCTYIIETTKEILDSLSNVAIINYTYEKIIPKLN